MDVPASLGGFVADHMRDGMQVAVQLLHGQLLFENNSERAQYL